MKLTDFELDLVSAYIRNELSGKILLDFKQKLLNNEALKQEVMLQKGILSAMRLNRVKDAMDSAKTENLLEDKSKHPQFEAISKTMDVARNANEQRKKRIRHALVTGAAAVCLLIVGTLGISSYLNNQLDNSLNVIVNNVNLDKLYQKIDGIKSVSGRSAYISFKLEEAQKAYQEKDWDTALAIFDKLEQQSEYKSVGIDFCKSIIFYNKKEYVKSIKKLESIDLSKAESTCEIHHFLTLSYLKIKNKTAAKKQFNLFAKNPQNCEPQLVKKLNKHFVL